MTVVEYYKNKAEECMQLLEKECHIGGSSRAMAVEYISDYLRAAAKNSTPRVISRRTCGKNSDLIKMLKLNGIEAVEVVCSRGAES